jgi:hypothetical protein
VVAAYPAADIHTAAAAEAFKLFIPFTTFRNINSSIDIPESVVEKTDYLQPTKPAYTRTFKH